MANMQVSKTSIQVLKWLEKMGIDANPTDESRVMYEFEYDSVFMYITTDTPDNEIFFSAPAYIFGESEERNRQVCETAENMIRDESEDYIVEYIEDGLSWIGQVYEKPKGRLRRYQLEQMLDDFVGIYERFLLAVMTVTASLDLELSED